MVFSFFKKPPQKMVAKPAAVPRPREGGLAAPTEPPDEKSEALARGAKPAAAPAVETKPSLDFSDFQFSESPQDFHVEADVDPVDADAEQAAVLYANGQDEAARTLLEDAVRVHHSGPGERLWLMLFDLYRLTGQRPAFEALGIEFAGSFEKSPPAWRDSVKVPAAANRAQVAGSALFKGELTGDNDAGFTAVRLALEKNSRLRLDLSKVKTLDATGCERLLSQLQQARKAKREIELIGRSNIGALLESRIEMGRAEDAGYWLLLLELYQLQGRNEDFEEAAINYAVTFEMSPPSWEPKRVAAAELPPLVIAVAMDDDSMGAAYIASGNIKASRFPDLPAFAEVHDPVLIDCAGVTRIDFISAGALLNVLSVVRRTGKQIVFRHPNHLVAELFGVVGLKAIAAIVLAKN